MQEIDIKKVLVISKSQMVAYVKTQQRRDPELTGRITNRMVLESLIFIEGYAKAIEKDIMLPVIKDDVHQLLLEKGFQYISKRVE